MTRRVDEDSFPETLEPTPEEQEEANRYNEQLEKDTEWAIRNSGRLARGE